MRAKWWDYATTEWYFVTICTRHRHELFGTVYEGELHLNDAGQMMETHWNAIPDRFPGVFLDAYVVMPNHLHGLIIISDDVKVALPDIIHWFKTITTTVYMRGVREQGWPRFDRHLWQRSYFDQIRRSNQHLANIRMYIETNPSNWHLDEENQQSINSP